MHTLVYCLPLSTRQCYRPKIWCKDDVFTETLLIDRSLSWSYAEVRSDVCAHIARGRLKPWACFEYFTVPLPPGAKISPFQMLVTMSLMRHMGNQYLERGHFGS